MMDEQLNKKTAVKSDDPPTSHIRREYETTRDLFLTQPPVVQRFLEAQARQLGEALVQRQAQVQFTLPDRVIAASAPGEKARVLLVPAEIRDQMAGGLVDRLTRSDLRNALRERLSELEQSSNQAVALGASLVRYATAVYMVDRMLPAGRTVTYQAPEGEEIPSIPVVSALEPESAITARTDAIVEEIPGEAGRGELIVPYVPAARRFYLPQWVAFDDEGRLLVNSVSEAQAHIASMQRFLGVLHTAGGLAPYILADEEYQQKRYGMLGQLVNQGRALGRYQTNEIIQTMWRRARSQDLNRGLSLSLPYFDDQALEMKTYDFVVIPAGRIMFVPAFVVRAAREEEVKIAQDTRLSQSTRKYLIIEMNMLEEAFETKEREM
jgi:hypothetical protein